MAKKIAYLITSNDVDGRGPTHIEYAFWDETDRDNFFEQDKNKNYYSKTEQIVAVDKETLATLAKLNGLERLLLGLVNYAKTLADELKK